MPSVEYIADFVVAAVVFYCVVVAAADSECDVVAVFERYAAVVFAAFVVGVVVDNGAGTVVVAAFAD